MKHPRAIHIFSAIVLCTINGYGEPSPARHELHPLSDPSPVMLDVKPADKTGTPSDGMFRITQVVNPATRCAKSRFVPSNGFWDCRTKLWILLDVVNHGQLPVLVRGGIRNTASSKSSESDGAIEVPPTERRILPILLVHQIPKQEEDRLAKQFGELRGLPGGHQNTQWQQVNTEALNVLNLEFFSEEEQIDCSVSGLRAVVDFKLPDPEDPFGRGISPVDRFGQERLHDWLSKIKTEADIQAVRRQEGAWMRQHPPLADRTIYGGWKSGPRLEKTGYFYSTKKDGKWWLVDPEGYLFWSLGITGVGSSGTKTRTPGLQQMLEGVPDGELSPKDFPSLNGNYWDPYQTNLLRKYGTEWKDLNIEVAHARLHAWGINTLGNWSDSDVCSARKTPYVTAIHYVRATLQNNPIKYGSDLPDVFHPQFKDKTFQRMREEIPETASDPWCIGYFIDNELGFPHAGSPATQSLAAPESCHSRQEFIRQLQERYGDLEKLNKAWNSEFGSWSGLKPAGSEKTTMAYREDIQRFSEQYLRTYYGTCRDAVKAAAPQKLYLGSRINHVGNTTALRVCAEYADIVSINLYKYTPDTFKIPEGWDKPILIGEFHFGTVTEQGVWGAGLATGMDLEHSASLFQSYVQAALRNPMIVGAHWFQMKDQPLTGRSDGENYRIGFLNVADIPYYEMISLSRKTAESMYNMRNKSPK